LSPQNESSLFSSSTQEDDLGTVKLTLQKFYRINGGATQLEGVVPDVVLPDRLEYLKFREKDNPSALKWDKISMAPYKTWVSTFSNDAIIKKANENVSKTASFEKIRTSVAWLEKNNNRVYSLNLEEYKESQKELKKVIKDIEEAYKLATPIDMKYLSVDTAKAKESSADRDKQWLKVRSEDIYIDKTVEIVNSMIKQSNLAKAN
jgi:carboxyl-terminal processing protease